MEYTWTDFDDNVDSIWDVFALLSRHFQVETESIIKKLKTLHDNIDKSSHYAWESGNQITINDLPTINANSDLLVKLRLDDKLDINDYLEYLRDIQGYEFDYELITNDESKYLHLIFVNEDYKCIFLKNIGKGVNLQTCII